MVVISITPLNFLKLLTQSEVVAISMSADPRVIYFCTLFTVSERVRGDDADLLQSLTLLRSLNLLSAESLAAITEKLQITIPA